MAEQLRCKGYVASQSPNNPGWKVRVKDPSSPHNGKWLVVASVHDNIALAKGLNVNFVIGGVDDPSGYPALRAVDVRVEVIE